MNLSNYLSQVNQRVRAAIAAGGFDADQSALLQQSTARVLAALHAGAYDNPLALLYLVARAWGRRPDQQMVHMGAMCLLYVCSLDLFDDVQDDDLDGKPHATHGAAIAINDAIALMALALSELRHGIACEVQPARRLAYLEAFNDASLRAVAGQHRDLSVSAETTTPSDVLQMHEAKTSSVALFVRAGALLGGCDAAQCARYQHVGDQLAQLVQIVDDLRDVFGKAHSPDLASGKATYPSACFRELASAAELERYQALTARGTHALPELRRLLYDTGVVQRCADTLERLRRDVHCEIAATGNPSAYHRVLLSVVDRLPSAIYEVEPVEETSRCFAVNGGFHEQVRLEAQRFAERMSRLGAPPLPAFAPWPHPHYLYEPATQVVYHPDLDGLADEILPFQAQLLGDAGEAAALEALRAQTPAVVAHELFHHWRHASGRLTADAWHEEYAANRLAVGYLRRFQPEVLTRMLELSERVLSRFADLLDASVDALLDGCRHAQSDGRAYGMDMQRAAVVHLEMVRRLAAQRPELEADVEWYLDASRRPELRAPAP